MSENTLSSVDVAIKLTRLREENRRLNATAEEISKQCDHYHAENQRQAERIKEVEQHDRLKTAELNLLVKENRSQAARIAELEHWCHCWRNGLETAAVVVEATSTGSPSEIAESIRDQFSAVNAKLEAAEARVAFLEELVDSIELQLGIEQDSTTKTIGGEIARLQSTAVHHEACGCGACLHQSGHLVELEAAESRVRELKAVVRMLLSVLSISDTGLSKQQQAEVDAALALPQTEHKP